MSEKYEAMIISITSDHPLDWTWDNQSWHLVTFVCETFTQIVAINYQCDLDKYLWMIREKYVSNWDEWLAHIIFKFFTIVEFFFYFIYGVVWKNRYDMGFAIGTEF